MYIVIGANGYLGSYIVKNILELTEERILATARDLSNVSNKDQIEWFSCDVQKEASVEKLMKKMQSYSEKRKLIYLAAFHHPDQVEKNQDIAWNINVTCLSKFVEQITRAGVEQAFYASTDSVYGESINAYHFKETDLLQPVNFYGHCKCAAEAIMNHQGYQVARFPFLISPSLVYKPHFYDEIVYGLKAGNKIEMYEDSYRSSLSFDNAAYLLIKLMELNISPQIVNICGDRDLSKYDVGCLIAKREGLDSAKVIPVMLSNMLSKKKQNFEVRRAASTLMDNTLLKECLRLKQVDIFDLPR